MSAQQAAARASLYRLLALVFDYPRQELFEALRSGEFQDALATIGNKLRISPVKLPLIRCDHQELEAAYIATFDFGRNGTMACSLHEGEYLDHERDRPLLDGETGSSLPLLEDLLRFYHHFGLRLVDNPAHRLLPDHLVCQLEMLSHLSLRENLAVQRGSEAAWYRSAQRDFLQRHVAVWLPRLARVLKECPGLSNVRRLYFAVADISAASVTAHLECYS